MAEIEGIRTHAAIVEKEKLNFRRIDPTNEKLCIYGQMTGDCSSERAYELIEKCCARSEEL